MHDRTEGVDRLAVQEDLHLDQVLGPVADGLVVERPVAPGPALELVEEVHDHLRQRQVVADLHPVLGEVVHLLHLAAALLAELHQGPEELLRRDDHRRRHGLPDLLDGRGVRHLGGVVDRDDLAGHPHHLVGDARHRDQQVEVELPLEALPHDLHVEQAEEAAPEAEAERLGGLGLIDEGRIVEAELIEGVAQVGVLVAVGGVEPGPHHRLGLPVAGQRLRGGAAEVGDRVADLGLPDVLHAGDGVADVAGLQPCHRHHGRGEDADLLQLVDGARGHHLHLLAGRELPIEDPHEADDAPVVVVGRVEDEGPGGVVRCPLGRGDPPDDLLQQVDDPGARLAGHSQDAVR